MKLATTTGDFMAYTHSQTQSIQYLAQAGFRYADYAFYSDYREHSGIYGQNPEEHISCVAETAEVSGVKLVQAHAPMGKPISEDNTAFLRDTIACVDICGRWGINNLVVHAGYAHGLSVRQTFERNKQFFLPVLERAEKYGINILIENFDKMFVPDLYWTDNAPDLLDQIEYINHPLCHAVWDIGHANLQKMPQDEALRLLGSHVRALHIQDNMGDADSHLPPFAGTVNLDSVMHGLLDIGYSGYFTFEVSRYFAPNEKRAVFEKDTRLAQPPLALRCAAERYLYELGKCILQAYNCFEE